MRFCLRPGAVSTDAAARIGYCQVTGIESVQESAASVPGFTETRELDLKALRDHVRQYVDGGITVEAMGLGQITPEVVLGLPEGEADFDRACRDIATIAEVGVRIVGSGLPIDEQPTEVANQEQLKRVADYYNRLCAVAERTGSKVISHSPWPPSRRGWMWAGQRFAEFFAAVPSPANGYLYDNAIHHMLSEDAVAAIHQFADRIFFVHIRDVRKSTGVGASGTGYEEVFPGTGEVDFLPVLRSLKNIGYRGVLCPEHYPVIPGDTRDFAATTYAVGYYRGLLAGL